MNNEFEVLYEFMEKLPGALKPGGRAAILTFHSGEDKLVKKALKQGYKEGVYSEIANDVVRPSAEECAQNGRARRCAGQSGQSKIGYPGRRRNQGSLLLLERGMRNSNAGRGKRT